jgi:hypothetical protein
LALREPCEFTRSPTMVGAGSWAIGVAVIIDDTCGMRGAGRALGSWPPTRSTSAAMCSVVVPQQPPTIETP